MMQGRPDEGMPFLEEAILLARQEAIPITCSPAFTFRRLTCRSFGATFPERLRVWQAPRPIRISDRGTRITTTICWRRCCSVSIDIAKRSRRPKRFHGGAMWKPLLFRALGRHAEAERVLREIIDGRTGCEPKWLPDVRQQVAVRRDHQRRLAALVDCCAIGGDTAMAFAEYERMKGAGAAGDGLPIRGRMPGAASPRRSGFTLQLQQANQRGESPFVGAARMERKETAGEERPSRRRDSSWRNSRACATPPTVAPLVCSR